MRNFAYLAKDGTLSHFMAMHCFAYEELFGRN
jgi:hypothetical protein